MGRLLGVVPDTIAGRRDRAIILVWDQLAEDPAAPSVQGGLGRCYVATLVPSRITPRR